MRKPLAGIVLPRLSLQALVLLAWLPLGGLGCPKPQEPADTARAYLAALSAGQADEAWALLSTEEQARVPLDVFRQRVSGLTDVQRQRYSELTASVGASDRTEARWNHSDGTELRLEHRGAGTWAVVGTLPRFDDQDTPRNALATFRRALKRADWPLLVRLAPAGERDELTTDLLSRRLAEGPLRDEILAALEALTVSGDGAAAGENGWVFRAGRHRADLRHEGGAWRVVDIR